MLRRLTASDLVSSYVLAAVQAAGGLVILPLLARGLSPEELAVWYVLQALATFSSVLDMGLGPAIGRSTTYILSGASSLAGEGIPERRADGSVDKELLGSFAIATGRVFLLLSAALVLVYGLALAGYRSLSEAAIFRRDELVVAWMIFALGEALRMASTPETRMLSGAGEIRLANRATLLSRVGFLGVGAAALLAGGGLREVAAANVAAALLGLVTARRAFRERFGALIAGVDGARGGAAREVLRALWPTSWRLAVVGLGTFLILRGNLIIVASRLDLATVAAYGLTVQLLSSAAGFAAIPMSNAAPTISSAWQRGKPDDAADAFSAALVAGGLAYAALASLVVFAAGPVLSGLGSRTSLLPAPVMAALAIVGLLETNHSLCGLFIVSANRVPFTFAALASGLAIAALTTAGLAATDLGIWSVVLSQGLVQVAYNNWRWPLEAARVTGVPFRRLLGRGSVRVTSMLLGASARR